jgi:hypothetical protein
LLTTRDQAISLRKAKREEPIIATQDCREAQGRAAAQERSVFVPRKTRMRTDKWAGLLASGSF